MATEKLRRVPVLLPRLILILLAGLQGPLAAAAAAGTAPAGEWAPIPPGGSRVQALAAVAGTGTVFAGTAYGGVFRSDDRGATWQPANRGLVGLDVTWLVERPDRPATLYAATEAGLFRSDDGAGSWRATGFDGAPAALALAPSAPATLYAASQTAAYRSDDGGDTWTPLQAFTGVGFVSALAVDSSSAQHVYLGGTDPATVLISRTGGRSWRRVTLPNAWQVFSLAADPARAGSVYAATDAGVFVTRNGGGSWAPVAGLGTGTYTAVGFAFGAPGTVYAAADRAHGRLFKSADSGATWRLVQSGSPLTAILGDPLRPQRVYAAATPGGVLHGPLADGSFQPQQGGLAASAVSSLAIDPATTGLLYAIAQLVPPSAQGLFAPEGLPASTAAVSRDGGATWQLPAGLPPLRHVLADPAAAGAAYALGVPQFQAAGLLPASVATPLLQTADGGASWQPVTSFAFAALDVASAPGTPAAPATSGAPAAPGASAPAAPPATLVATGYAVDPRGLPCPIFCSPVVTASSDGGATWSFNPNLPAVPYDTDDAALWAVRFDPTDAHTIYVLLGGAPIKTIDGGQSWSALDLGAAGGEGTLFLTDLAVDPQQPQRLYAVRQDGTAIGSTDGGQTWQAPLGTGLPAGAVRRLVAGPGSPLPVLYAATAQGVFASSDRGATWAPFGTGLPVSSVLLVATDPAHGRVYAGTEGGGGLFALTPP